MTLSDVADSMDGLLQPQSAVILSVIKRIFFMIFYVCEMKQRCTAQDWFSLYVGEVSP